jgi:2-oxoisovalerate dehydrogenase E1 component
MVELAPATATDTSVSTELLLKAYTHMCQVQHLARVYDEHRDVCRYVHSTSRGHEAAQLAMAYQLKPYDYVYPYYRDESILLGIGMTPYELMLQLLAKRDDPFSGGRTYYAHPSLRRPVQPKIPHQSSATGMQAIPATGAAQGIAYLERQHLPWPNDATEPPVVVCSLGDGSVTEGEVSEAMQMAVLHKLPVIYLVQDNDWGISASGDEMRAMTAYEFAAGFMGLHRFEVDGSDFRACYEVYQLVIELVRTRREPALIHVRVPLLGHHTSGVRREWYRGKEELAEHQTRDPYLLLHAQLLEIGITSDQLEHIDNEARERVEADFARARAADDPTPADLETHIYAPTPITAEVGTRSPKGGTEVVMVDAALHAVEEILRDHPEALLYGQDVGHRLGGVFREAATLADKFGRDRVFNTPIQEAYIIGSTAGMSAVGTKPMVEVQFADYIWPGLNQLFTELSRSCYLSNGKWPVQSLIRVPIGAYNGGGPYHSSSVESVLLNIRGVKVVYPSNAADMKGLLKAAFYDPNPVVILEHKGLYWSKVPGTKEARAVEPDAAYRVPLGKARTVRTASAEALAQGDSCAVITWGMGVYWTLNSEPCKQGRVELLDLRSLEPLDWPAIEAAVARHGKVLVVTEEPELNTFAEALVGRISRWCFRQLDAPVQLVGSAFVPAIGLSSVYEQSCLPNAERVSQVLEELLGW